MPFLLKTLSLFTAIIVYSSICNGSNLFTRILLLENDFMTEHTFENVRTASLCLAFCVAKYRPCNKTVWPDLDSGRCRVGSHAGPAQTGTGIAVYVPYEVAAQVTPPRIFVFGGYDSTSTWGPSQTQILNLEPPSTSLAPEMTDLRDFVGFWPDYQGGLLACRNYNADQDCYLYNLDIGLVHVFPTIHAIAPYLQTEGMFAYFEGKPWLLGGRSSSDWDVLTKATEVLQPDNTWIPGPDLPHGAHGSCICPLDDAQTKHLMAGGRVELDPANRPMTAKSWIYESGLWTPLGDMPGSGKYFIKCDRVVLNDGRTVVVAAGGSASVASADVGIFDVDARTWAPGPPLPAARSNGFLIAVPSSLMPDQTPRVFYLGGFADRYVSDQIRDDVFELRVDDLVSGWEERTDLRLEAKSFFHGAVLMP